MPRIVIELTNRCNLSCTHCFDGRHSADGDIKLEIIEKVLKSAKSHGFNHLSFTGGDPTIHPRFGEIIKMASDAGYYFGLVTNGQNFTKVYKKILPCREQLSGITFSLDGARCVVKEIPFTFNMVITSRNCGELEGIAELATRLGSSGLRFGHLMPTPLTTVQNLDLSPGERRKVEAAVWRLQKNYPIPIVMAPGYYTTDLFPCAPLRMEEFNIDWRGNVTK